MEDIDADLDERSETQQTNEMLYNSWEQDCISTIENGADIDKHLSREQDVNAQKLWATFQNTSCSVAQLFKVVQSNDSRLSLWSPFQQAASNVTNLYQEGLENQKRFQDLHIQFGVQKRNREVLAWAKKQKRCIRREDLISFLSGRINNYSNNFTVTRRNLDGRNDTYSTAAIPNVNDFRLNADNNIEVDNDFDFLTFRQAIALSGRNSGIRRSAAAEPTVKHNQPGDSTESIQELNEFISNEYSRHLESRKRRFSSTDVNMDSPTQKRFKLT